MVSAKSNPIGEYFGSGAFKWDGNVLAARADGFYHSMAIVWSFPFAMIMVMALLSKTTNWNNGAALGLLLMWLIPEILLLSTWSQVRFDRRVGQVVRTRGILGAYQTQRWELAQVDAADYKMVTSSKGGTQHKVSVYIGSQRLMVLWTSTPDPALDCYKVLVHEFGFPSLDETS